MVTHYALCALYALDALLISVTGGLVLAYPLSCETWQLDLVRPDNRLGTTILVAAAVLIWLVLKAWRRTPKLNQKRTSTRSSAHLYGSVSGVVTLNPSIILLL